jgi:hypothetical protein
LAFVWRILFDVNTLFKNKIVFAMICKTSFVS